MRSLAWVVAILLWSHGLSAQQAHQQKPGGHMEHRFEDAEKYAKSFDDPARDEWQPPEPVIAALAIQPGHAVADIGVPNRDAYFRELKRSLKPSGRLAIIDFRKGAPAGPPEEFRFTPGQITAELLAAGFTLQTQHDFLPRQIFLVYRME